MADGKDVPERFGSVITLPPSDRIALETDTHPSHPRAPVFCERNDFSCGREVDTWRRLADADLIGRRSARASPLGHSTLNVLMPKFILECASQARKEPKTTRYREWLGCVSSANSTIPAVPIGRFRTPSWGSLLLFEHDNYGRGCLKVRTYELATGGAHVLDTCHFRERRAEVDRRTTGPDIEERHRVGQVSRSAISRALWMLISQDHMENAVQVYSRRIEIPEGVEPRWHRDAEPAPDRQGVDLPWRTQSLPNSEMGLV